MNKLIMNSVKKNDIISFVGSGGKTTIMFNIAYCAAKIGYKVLVCTTTKIYIPEKYCYEKIVLRETISEIEPGYRLGITVFGSHIENSKIVGSSEEDLKEYIDLGDFDLILIEADGSRKKSIKAYYDNEPVVPKYSNKVFAIVSMDAIGLSINEKNIYNFTKMMSILSKNENDIVTKEDIVTLLESEEGLFKAMDCLEKYAVLTKCVNKERIDDFKFISDRLKFNVMTYMNY